MNYLIWRAWRIWTVLVFSAIMVAAVGLLATWWWRSLGYPRYGRLRIGIASHSAVDGEELSEAVEKFVLEAFSENEEKALKEIWQRGFDACRLWVTASVDAAMNAVNPARE